MPIRKERKDDKALFHSLGRLSPDEQDERARIRKLSLDYRGLPIDQWPNFEVIWDTEPSKQRYAYDGVSEKEFLDMHPDGLILALVKLSHLDRKLSFHSKRTPEEVWGVGGDDKAAEVLVHWVEGRRLTPALILMTSGTNEICIGGGNHRVAVARAKGELEIPILVDPDQLSEITAHISLRYPDS